MFTVPSMTIILASTAVWLSLIFFYRLGRNTSQDEVIEKTVVYLVQEGYVKFSRDENGEIELHKLED